MAAEVASQFSAAQVDEYGNIIKNGYLSVVPNTTNKKAWQYAETTTAPADLPSLTETRPAYRGWTTNYMQYYTELKPNGYNQNPGNPTMFEYSVHRQTPLEAPAIGIGGFLTGGIGYPVGTFTNVTTQTSGNGFGALVNVVVGEGPDGFPTSLSISNDGTGTYPPSVTLQPVGTQPVTGVGAGLTVGITTGAAGEIAGVGIIDTGINYQAGDIVSVDGGTGQLTIDTVGPMGIVTSMTLASAGSNYAIGDTLIPDLPPGAGASIQITSVYLDAVSGGGEPEWAQAPRRFNQLAVDNTSTPQYVNNPAVIQYSFLHPVADNPVAPPVGNLNI
jgi:hypothetical protein